MPQGPRGGPISVVLDASPLLLRSAGVKNYVYYWARSLAEQAKPNSLQLFLSRQARRHRSSRFGAGAGGYMEPAGSGARGQYQRLPDSGLVRADCRRFSRFDLSSFAGHASRG